MRDVLRSWWVLLALLPFGWLNWSAFVYAGARARRPLWLAFAGLYLALAAVSLVLLSLDPDSDADTWEEGVGAGLAFALWIGTFVHALVIRKPYLERMDALEHPYLDKAEDALRVREVALELVADDPRRARELGVGRPDVEGSFDGGLVDVNHAAAAAIAELPGIDDATALRAVALREEIGGFDSLLDFAHLLDLPPDTVDRLRERAIVLPR